VTGAREARIVQLSLKITFWKKAAPGRGDKQPE
jgi:hypothetical protein